MRRPLESQWRFLLNTSPSKLEVHDQDNEKSECQISEIIKARNAKYLKIDNTDLALSLWLKNNPQYDGCKYCLQKFHKK